MWNRQAQRRRVHGMRLSLATRAVAALAVPLAAVPAMTVPVLAQDTSEARLRRIEGELRALQRKVFPGGDGKFFTPEITAAQAPAGTPGTPATTPVTDILARMDSLEAQIARLTAQTEQNGNRLNQIEAKLGMVAAPAVGSAASPSATPAPAAASTAAGVTSAVPAAPAAAPAATATPAVAPAPAATPTPAPTPAPAPAPAAKPAPVTPAAPAGPSAQRVAAVRAIVKPQTNDPGDDEYSYGFRLWEARFFPEAQQQLKLFVDKYPRHPRLSFGRNLLGRAFLDDGKPREAATWFLQNYQADKSGARASDSLLYLAVAMKELKDNSRTCIALNEFAQTYAAEAAGRLKSAYDAARAGVKCNS